MKHGKLYIAGGALGAGLILAGGWFLGVQPQLAAAEASAAQLASVQQLNGLQATRLAQLQSAGEDISSLESQRGELERALPTTPDVADLLGELGALESATGATVSSITSGQVQLIGDPVGEAAAPADTASAADAPATTVSAALVPVPGMQSIPITLSAKGSAGAINAFLSGLQGKGRLISMSSISIGSDESTGESRLDLSGVAYVLPSTS